ncbi:MAG: pyocin activator PrtN family protein [Cohaesibacter sp.]|nr:pyocin activator PrtN family protein [Cohaesibacter sp.]
MKTVFLLMAQYDGQAVIPLETICGDFFGLTHQKFMRKLNDGQIDLPVIRMENSQKCKKGVHVQDLADYIEKRRKAAQKEHQAFFG